MLFSICFNCILLRIYVLKTSAHIRLHLKGATASRHDEHCSYKGPQLNEIHLRMIPPSVATGQHPIPRLAISTVLDYCFSPAGRLA